MKPTDAQHEAEPLSAILNSSENEALLRLASMVGHIFRAPIAYLALLGGRDEVWSRIGSGSDYWSYLKTFPLARVLQAPVCIHDSAAETLPEGTDLGPVRFAAGAPLRSSDGLELGVLVVADLEQRPGFTEADLSAFQELACVLAGKMELRALAANLLDIERSLRESERRFRAIANAVPVMIGYSSTSGSCLFTNAAWREFTGRGEEEELGDGWFDTIHPEDRARITQGHYRAVQERRPFSADVRLLRHDGKYRRLSGKAMPRFLEDGTFSGLIVSLLDAPGSRSH